jgi:hypothetical protein
VKGWPGCCSSRSAAALIASTGAGVVNHAPVGVPGRNETEGYSPALSIVFASPPGYVVKCCVDNDSGDWKGPSYQSSGSPPITGDSEIDWSASFERSSGKLERVARDHLIQGWPDLSTGSLSVPHTIGRRRVGTIPGFTLVTKGPGQSAQVEAALSFPLCRGLTVVARFSLLSPYDDSDTAGGHFTVNGQLASTWNEAQAAAAMKGVSVAGNLPPGKIVARAAGRKVVGLVRDCRGGPLVGVRVRLVPGGGSARTSAAGAFSIPVRKPGQYCVTVTLAGTASSAKVRVGK